eukprot:206065_1
MVQREESITVFAPNYARIIPTNQTIVPSIVFMITSMAPVVTTKKAEAARKTFNASHIALLCPNFFTKFGVLHIRVSDHLRTQTEYKQAQTDVLCVNIPIHNPRCCFRTNEEQSVHYLVFIDHFCQLFVCISLGVASGWMAS